MRPIWSLAEDALGDLFAFDSRFFTTMVPLIFKPGSVTKQFMQGKRARFMPPFRLYLVVSVVFFLTLALSDLVIFDAEKAWRQFQQREINVPTDSIQEATGSPMGDEELAKESMVGSVPVPEGEVLKQEDIASSMEDEASEESIKGTVAGPDSLHEDEMVKDETGNASEDEVPDDELNRLLFEDGSIVEILDLIIAQLDNRQAEGSDPNDSINKVADAASRILPGARRVASDPVLLNRLFADQLPKLMFLMLPFFALLLKLVYVRRKRLYIEHLVFSLHFHAPVFLLLTLMVLLHQYVVVSRPYLPWLLWYIPIYLVIAMWRQYDQGPIRTFLKAAIVSAVYGLVMSVNLGISVLFGLSQL